jgi:hypothetical protein
MLASAMRASRTEPLSRVSSTATPTVGQSIARRLYFRYDQPVQVPSFGTRISTSSSPGSIAVSHTARKNLSAGTVRSPPLPRITSSPPRASTTVGRSPAGSACASEPPIVPRWRTCGSPISPAAKETIGQCSCTSGSRARSACLVSAPIARCSPASRT